MQLARVKGTVVSTNKAEKLNGLKLQLIKPIDLSIVAIIDSVDINGSRIFEKFSRG